MLGGVEQLDGGGELVLGGARNRANVARLARRLGGPAAARDGIGRSRSCARGRVALVLTRALVFSAVEGIAA
jgi:hypothetical protein